MAPPRLIRRTAALSLTLGLFAPAAQAARPLMTDDARIVEPRACQLESWGMPMSRQASRSATIASCCTPTWAGCASSKRHLLVPDRVQIDTTFGNRFGQDTQTRWFSIGLRLLSVPFLP